MPESDVVVVLVTVPDERAAAAIARPLVEERLAACVNVVGPIRSYYWWEGALQNDEEYLLIVKARRSALARVDTRVRALHDADLPEVVALPVVGGSAAYLAWVHDATEG